MDGQIEKVSDTEFKLTQTVETVVNVDDIYNQINILQGNIDRSQAEIDKFNQQISDLQSQLDQVASLDVMPTAVRNQINPIDKNPVQPAPPDNL